MATAVSLGLRSRWEQPELKRGLCHIYLLNFESLLSNSFFEGIVSMTELGMSLECRKGWLGHGCGIRLHLSEERLLES